jgi:hypothetical protein
VAHAEDVACLQVGLDFRAAAESEVVCSGQEHGTDAEGEKGRVQLRRSYVNGSQLKGLPQRRHSLGSNPCSEKRTPPAKRQSPRTSTVFTASVA